MVSDCTSIIAKPVHLRIMQQVDRQYKTLKFVEIGVREICTSSCTAASCSVRKCLVVSSSAGCGHYPDVSVVYFAMEIKCSF